jgi:hypothetical protein
MHPLIPLAIVLFSSLALPQAEVSPATRDVCSALQQLATLDGTTMTIRGEYEAGMEVAAIYKTSCAGAVQLEGGAWPWAIHVVRATIAAGSDKDGGQTSLGRLEKLAQETDHRKFKIIVTLKGRLTSARHNPPYVGSQEPRPIGFGNGGVFPAEFSVIDATDIRVEPKAARKN